MTTTTCACGLGETADLCDFCALNLWAARIEQRLGVLEYESDRDDTLSENDVERIVENAINDHKSSDDHMSEREVEDLIERNTPDFDDYVEKDELQGAIEEAIEELDIVKDVAAGAAEAAMKLHRFAAKTDLEAVRADLVREIAEIVQRVEDRLNADAPKRADVFAGLSRWQRVRLVFGF